MLVALSEMTLLSEFGLKIEKPKKLSNQMEYYFGEDQGRYLITVDKDNLGKVKTVLAENNIFNEIVAFVQRDNFEIPGELKINTKELLKINNKWYDNY